MRTLEGSNRVRNGLMGIIVLLLVIGVGQSFASVPMLFATPTYYAQFSDTGGSTRATRCASQAWTSAGCGRWDRRRQGRHRLLARRDPDRYPEPRRHPDRHHPGPQEHRDRTARFGSVARQRGSSPRADHDAVPDLRRVLRCDEGGVRLGHPDGEAVVERVVRDHRSDLSAPVRRARRCRAVLRHHRQARRSDQTTARQRQQDRGRPRQPQ